MRAGCYPGYISSFVQNIRQGEDSNSALSMNMFLELSICRLISGAFCEAFGNELIAAAVYGLDVFAVGRF